MSATRPVSETPVSLTDLLQRAIRRQRSGDTAGAREHYRSVLAESPRNGEALALLGELELAAGDHRAAAGYLRAALRIEPGRVENLDRLGRALLGAGESRAAMRALLRAIELEPHYAPAYVGMGRAFAAAGRSKEARRCFAEACRLDPALAEAQLAYAHALDAADRPDEAERFLRRGIELDPEPAAPRLRYARLLFEQGHYADAEAQYDEVLRRGAASALAHIGRAAALTEQYRLSEALDACQRALQCDARSADAMVQIGRIHLRRGDTAGALTAFGNANTVAPGHVAARLGLASILEAEGRLGEALPAVRAAIRDRGDVGAEADLIMARILRKTGEFGEAQQRLRIRLAMLPESAAHDRRRLEREAARIHEEDGNLAAALLHYATAASLGRTSFDSEASLSKARGVLTYFDTSTFARLSRARTGAATPVIVTGMPSAGVRQVLASLAAHRRVVPSARSGRLGTAAHALAGRVASGRAYPQCLSDARSADLDRIVAEFWPEYADAGSGACVVVDATWEADVHLGLAEVLFPSARVVHCTRDPRDAVLGCYFRDYDGPECDFGGDLADVVARLRLHNRLMHHWRRTGDLRFLTVSREALADDPHAETQRLLAFLDLDVEPACLANAGPGLAIGARGFYTPALDPSIGRHRAYAPLLGQTLDVALTAPRHDRGGENEH